MAGKFADLTAILSLDSVSFHNEINKVNRELEGLSGSADEMNSRIKKSFDTLGNKTQINASSLRNSALSVQQSLERQTVIAQRAGISVGQYRNAMRMLPAQLTDVATQLAGGQNPWLILLQQGGQVKDSFGGMIPMFRGLAGAITLPMLGVTALAVATGALAYAWYQGDLTLSEFNKTLVLSGNQSGLTADSMLALSRAGQDAGLTFNETSESLKALVSAGVRGGEQFDAMSQSVARFSSASGVELDKVAEAFGKLTTDPTSGLVAMARQFHNVTAEQIAYVAQLQRSGDEAGALQAANEAATKGFDDQTRRLKENMGTLETWADKTGKAFKSMWDAIMDIGRPESSVDMLASAQKAFDEADKKWQWYQSRSQRRGKTSSFRANLQGAWDDRENARLGLSAATLQSDMEKAGELAARDRAERDASQLKYTEEAIKAYERLQTPLDKYTLRQKELNRALKDGKILQEDYNTLMAAAKKDYESTIKKPKNRVYTEDYGTRMLDNLNRQNEALRQQISGNEKLTNAARQRIQFEKQIADLREKTQLTADQKSLLSMAVPLREALLTQEALEEQISTLDKFRNMQNELRTREEKLRDVTAERLEILDKMRDSIGLQREEYDRISASIAEASITAMPADVQRNLRRFSRRETEMPGLEAMPGYRSFTGIRQEMNSLNDMDNTQGSLDNWFQDNLKNLERYRQERADLNARWDEQEAALRQKYNEESLLIEQQRNASMSGIISTGLTSMVDMTRDAFGEKSAIYKAAFLADKAYAIAQATMAIQTGVSMAASKPFPENIIGMASVLAATASIISTIQSVRLEGMAHDGIDKIPATGTWLLQKGERVMTSSTSAKLDKTLERVSQQRNEQILSAGMNYSPVYQINGDPNAKTIQLMEEAAKRGAEEGYNRVVENLTRGTGSVHHAVNTMYATRRAR